MVEENRQGPVAICSLGERIATVSPASSPRIHVYRGISHSRANTGRLTPPSRPLQIQRQQPPQDFLSRQIRRPAVGGGDGGVEFLVGQGEPGGAFVVEVGQGAFFQVLGAGGVFGDQTRVADGADAARVGVVDVGRQP